MRPLWEAVERKGKRGLRYNFHAGQLRAWQSTARFVAPIAGTQGGKTSFEPLWLHREIQARGPGDYLAVTATFPLLKLKMLPEFLKFFGPETLNLGQWKAADHAFQFHADETRIIFGSATHPESLESATAKAAVLDEAGQDQFRLGSWEAIQRRLSLAEGRALIATTPYNMGWLKQQIYDPWRAGDTSIEVVQFPSISNPAFPVAEFERMKGKLPAWKFAMFYLGQFMRPAGQIYGDYSDEYREDGGHKVHAFDVPPSWPRYVGIDFGAVHTALIWLAVDPAADVMYLYAESMDGDKTTKQHAAAALAKARGVNVLTWHGGAKSETQQRMDWREAGVPIQEPRVWDVESGIDKVIGLFKTRQLFVFDSCAGVRDELGTYSREVGEDGQPTEAIKDKADFHRLDAVRYGVLGALNVTVESEDTVSMAERVEISPV
jgi:hypothetical protein